MYRYRLKYALHFFILSNWNMERWAYSYTDIGNINLPFFWRAEYVLEPLKIIGIYTHSFWLSILHLGIYPKKITFL